MTTLRNSASGLFAGMTARLGADLREGLERRAVALHVLAPGAAEVAQRQRNLRLADELVAHRVEAVERCRPVGEHCAERAGLHLLEAERQHAVGAPHSIAWRARNSAVEPVEQLLLTLTIGMPVMPDLVERALPAGRVAVDVADVGLLQIAS